MKTAKESLKVFLENCKCYSIQSGYPEPSYRLNESDILKLLDAHAKQFQPKAENIETYPKEFVIWLLSDNGPLKDKESSLLKADKNLYYDINEVFKYWVTRQNK